MRGSTRIACESRFVIDLVATQCFMLRRDTDRVKLVATSTSMREVGTEHQRCAVLESSRPT